MYLRRSIRIATMAALALGVGACSDETTSPSEEGATIADYVASASIEDAEGALQPVGTPRPTGDGPTVSVDGHLTIVNGGTAALSVSSPTPFQTVYVAGTAPISGLFVPMSGYFSVPLPAATTSADLLITFPQALPSNDFELFFSAADPAGNIGGLVERSFEAFTVGTGDVQVTLNWDTEADVDLHVVDPGGYEIYWASRQSPSGGELDLDSNAACSGDGVGNENITWAAGTAPVGTYHVRVDYWSSCDVGETRYTVLIHNDGDIEIHRGTFTGSGDNGGQGSGVEIADFSRSSGPQPVANPNRSAPVSTGPTTK